MNTLHQTFKSARTQLPGGEKGIIFAIVPEEWIKEPDIEKMVVEAIEKCFRDSSRVAGIVIQVENLLYAAKTEEWFSVVHRVYRNKSQNVLTPDLNRLLDEINSRILLGPWTSFWGIAKFATECGTKPS